MSAFLRIIVLAAALSCGFTSQQAGAEDTDSDTIQQQATQLADALRANGNRVLSNDTQTALNTVRTHLFNYQRLDIQTFFASLADTLQDAISTHGERPFSETTRTHVAAIAAAVFEYDSTQRDRFIRLLATELREAYLDDGRGALAPETIEALGLLTSAIEEDEATPEAIRIRATTLIAQLQDEVRPDLTDDTNTLLALENLRTRLLDIEDPNRLTRVIAQATRLHALIGEGSNATLLTTLLDPGQVTALSNLRNRLTGVLRDGLAPSSGIFIVSARFGQISGPSEGGGTCNARPTLVAQCHAEQSCSLGPDQYASLCGGYDPAPFAEAQHRGLQVQYICMQNQPRSVWNSMLSADPALYAGRSLTVILRSEHDGFRCAMDEG